MKNYWIVGHPLKFCLAMPVMNGAFKELGIDAHFETKDLNEEQFEEAMQMLKSGELAGIMPTAPYKTPSVKAAEEINKRVKVINSTNLLINNGNKVKAYNFDWYGALGAIESFIEDLSGKQVHVIGAGGAARSAAYACQSAGAKVSIWNRTPERAKAFAEEIGIEWVEDMRTWGGHPNIIINATSISSNDSQSTLVPFQLWKDVELAMDAVYGKTSLFLEEAKAMNVAHILSGEVWFLKQIVPMFMQITGQEAPIKLMEQICHEAKEIKS
ncbi:NAD(P)-binding domain-containing protein [Candidatus Peregrinibacteria bacterium]|jgi:shikimate dehydrogenase|nr:NAD(P)-binding domain-containing protein [Candidatus Peregrinibacteria bacterium]MBT5823557.1 NAD(P)-binding domain-containing protein [Candidatus Peregrinibacteria bacterium]